MLNPGDIVLVKFPFSEGKGHKWRPALVVSGPGFHKRYGMCWVAMITSAENAPWPSDIPIPTSKETGLQMACVVRPAKIASLHNEGMRKLGKISASLLKETLSFVKKNLG